jgi:hypothetical protein
LTEKSYCQILEETDNNAIAFFHELWDNIDIGVNGIRESMGKYGDGGFGILRRRIIVLNRKLWWFRIVDRA